MDVQTIRRRNLEYLVSEAGSQKALALRLEWTANYISQILTGHRNLGDKSARWIERSLGMEHGAMDGVLEGASAPASEPSPDENDRAALASVPVPVLTLEELSRPALVSVALEWRSGPSRGFIEVGETIQAQHGQPICGVSLDDRSLWSIAVIVKPGHLRAGDVVLKRPKESGARPEFSRYRENEETRGIFGKVVELVTRDQDALASLCPK
ncbi:hypothetical protein [Thioalkalivibrio sp. ALE19]|uniref:hypothetical protein n=1 Tax=Thioalkalivibrio sp. ALE19 TaxID=1266909 RepID=UPI000411952D|nr:hypothetical protein [Thioalkalivibrio sp. ALE19]